MEIIYISISLFKSLQFLSSFYNLNGICFKPSILYKVPRQWLYPVLEVLWVLSTILRATLGLPSLASSTDGSLENEGSRVQDREGRDS